MELLVFLDLHARHFGPKLFQVLFVLLLHAQDARVSLNTGIARLDRSLELGDTRLLLLATRRDGGLTRHLRQQVVLVKLAQLSVQVHEQVLRGLDRSLRVRRVVLREQLVQPLIEASHQADRRCKMERLLLLCLSSQILKLRRIRQLWRLHGS